MKFTIFLCSAFIVSVACVTEPGREKRKLEFNIKECVRSINKAIRELYDNYLDDSVSHEHREEHFKLLHKPTKQLGEVIAAARKASSMELSEPLPRTPRGSEIVCSKELAAKVLEIVRNEYAAVKALDA